MGFHFFEKRRAKVCLLRGHGIAQINLHQFTLVLGYTFALLANHRVGLSPLWSAPEVHQRSLVHAGNCAMGRARLFRVKLAADIFPRILRQGNAGITALLRTVMHQPVFADIEKA